MEEKERERQEAGKGTHTSVAVSETRTLLLEEPFQGRGFGCAVRGFDLHFDRGTFVFVQLKPVTMNAGFYISSFVF